MQHYFKLRLLPKQEQSLLLKVSELPVLISRTQKSLSCTSILASYYFHDVNHLLLLFIFLFCFVTMTYNAPYTPAVLRSQFPAKSKTIAFYSKGFYLKGLDLLPGSPTLLSSNSYYHKESKLQETPSIVIQRSTIKLLGNR